VIRIGFVIVGSWLVFGCDQGNGAGLLGPMEDPRPGDYVVLQDAGDSRVRIGVATTTTDEGLRQVLRRAADERQTAVKRDHLMSDYFWVEAYLVKDGRVSRRWAGRLRRYVPISNWPANWSDRGVLWASWVLSLPHGERISVALESARESLGREDKG